MADSDYSLNIKRNIRGLDVIQAVYAFIMALGMREVFIGSHSFFTTILLRDSEINTHEKLVFLMLFLNAVLLGVRFFWVPRNLRRIVYVYIRNNYSDPEVKSLTDSFVSANWVIIILHGFLYFLLCSEFEHIVFNMTSTKVLDPSNYEVYFYLHIVILLINAFWIAFLVRHEVRVRNIDPATLPAGLMPGGVTWFRNNLLIAVMALGPLVLIADCQSEVSQCLRVSGITASGDAIPLPLSPDLLANALQFLMKLLNIVLSLFTDSTIEQRYWVSYWALTLFMYNSTYDLYKSGKYYIILEDVDWDAKKNEGSKVDR